MDGSGRICGRSRTAGCGAGRKGWEVNFIMLGFYDYTVVLTYAGFLSAVAGIFCGLTDHVPGAVMCLLLAGVCDLFDGKVAGTKKDRSEQEKVFGIQIDSLSDLVSFGVLPVVICYRAGMNRLPGMLLLALYALAGLIRLAYYNVSEVTRQSRDEGARTSFNGLPITTVSLILPVVMTLASLFDDPRIFVFVLHACVGIMGLLFVWDFRLRKLSPKQVGMLLAVVVLTVLAVVSACHGWSRLWFMPQR